MGYIENLEKEHAERQEVKARQMEIKKTLMIEGIVEGKSPTRAAKDAGFGVLASQTPYKLIPADELRRRFQEVVQSKGLTMDRIGEKLLEHIDARANQTLNGKEVTQSSAPDYKIQQKALDQLTTFMGMNDAAAKSGNVSSVSLNISGPAADRLAALLGGE